MNAHRHAAGLLTILFGDNPKDASAHSLLFLRFSAHLCFLSFGARQFKAASARGSLKTLERWACLILFLCRLESELARFNFYIQNAFCRPESTSARHRPDSTSIRQSLELTLACRRPPCPERPNLVRYCARVKNPCFFPLALSLFLPRPSDERYLLDFIFGFFTGARIRGGTKGRRRPKHLR